MVRYKIGNMTREEAEDIFALQEMRYWKTNEAFIQRYIDSEIALTINFPKSNQEDIGEDIIYKLGLIKGLKIALAQPYEAQQLLETEDAK